MRIGKIGKIAGMVFGLAISTIAWAEPRPWTFVEDAYPLEANHLAYQQFVTYSTRTEADHGFDNYQFKQQLEYGLSEKVNVSLYAGTFNYEDSAERTGTHYEETSVEGTYFFTSPVEDPIGIAFLAEVGFGEHGFSLLNRLILQKDIGHWSFCYNLGVENAFDNAYNAVDDESAHVNGAIGNEFGISYLLTDNWRVGGELTVESLFPRWSDYEDTTVYAGPNFGYQRHVGESEFWFTVTPLFQLSSVDEEPQFTVRMIAGWIF